MLPIPSAPKYHASSDGRIWRWGRPLTARTNGKGYLRVTVSINNVPRTRYIHRLVAEAYHGPCPDEFECRHLNGDRSDNRSENLSWSNKRTNELDKIAHGTTRHGERNPMHKLTAEIVITARIRAAAGEDIRNLAIEFGFSRATLADAIMGRRWQILPGAMEPFSTRRKFTEDQVREIRRRGQSERHKDIAEELGVAQTAISAIVRGATYGHVK